MNQRVATAFALLIVFCASPVCEAQDDLVALSPSGEVQIKVKLEAARPRFSVTRKNAAIVESSPLVMTLDGVDILESSQAGPAERYSIHATYPWRGMHSQARNHCNGAKIPLRHPKTGTAYTLDIRAFDDGVAFRFVITGGEQKRAPDETTTFILPAGSTAWYHDLSGHYEATYTQKAVGEIKAGEWAAPPLTFKLPGSDGYASITEAALLNYSGMALQGDGQRGFTIALGHKHPLNRPFQLRYGEEEHKRLSAPASIGGTITTPWRVILVGADLNTLVNSDILHNLCPPPDPKLFPQGFATEWIKPGRAVWKYLDGGQNSLEEMKRFSEAAGQLGFEHNIIEGFWRRWSKEELHELVAYAKSKNVGTWLWRHSKEIRTPEARREFFKTCQEAGVAGVKIDFFDHEAKEVVDLYEPLLREAAEHKLMVNFHGANKPTGLSRTWPNELTREAVRGMESSRLKERAVHNTTLPFTRLLAGHADYTPVHFGPRRGDTTLAHQIASAAILDSSLLTYGAYPAKLLESPAVKMISAIAATWDETRVLPPSEIAQCAVYARRKDKTWFLAVLNGPAARSIEIPLAFLPAGKHQSLIVQDKPGDDSALDVQTSTASAGEVLKLNLAPGGGFIARFTAAP